MIDLKKKDIKYKEDFLDNTYSSIFPKFNFKIPPMPTKPFDPSQRTGPSLRYRINHKIK